MEKGPKGRKGHKGSVWRERGKYREVSDFVRIGWELERYDLGRCPRLV